EGEALEPSPHGHELASRGEAEKVPDQGQADTEGDIDRGAVPLPSFGQRNGLVAERGKGGVAAAEADREERPDLGGDGRGLDAVSQDEAEQERAADVDQQGANGESAARQALRQPPDEIAADASDGAAHRDVPDHVGRYTFPLCFASPS